MQRRFSHHAPDDFEWVVRNMQEFWIGRQHITMQKLSSMQKRLCMHEKGNASIDILIRVILILFALISYLTYIYIYKL